MQSQCIGQLSGIWSDKRILSHVAKTNHFTSCWYQTVLTCVQYEDGNKTRAGSINFSYPLIRSLPAMNVAVSAEITVH